MQSVYTLAHSKFGHDLGRISMDCKVFIKTGPVAQEELDEYYASKADATTTDIAP
jgi:hemerythrin-like domain-containing protein